MKRKEERIAFRSNHFLPCQYQVRLNHVYPFDNSTYEMAAPRRRLRLFRLAFFNQFHSRMSKLKL